MTHYWWMHWFWITSRLTLCVVIIHSTEATTVSSPVPASYLNPQENLNLTESSEPMNSTTICNKTIFNENLETSSSANDLENSTTTNIDVENTTVIVTQSKELVSKGVHGQQQVEATWTAASITGLCLGVVAVATVLAAASVVLYRRRYLNKPHALNDKCSNPDSSGYIDDSTMRENSEEMYSLDNDSFLNSLEAMTIQNYWTDSVKHTKL